MLINIQYLRAIAALLVAITHAAADVGRLHKIDVGYPIPGPFGVEIFFVISGFIIYHSNSSDAENNRPLISFYRARFFRIVPLYWLYTTAYLILSYIIDKSINRSIGNESIIYIISSYLFFPYEGPSGTMSPLYSLGWSLNFEIFFYALFGGTILTFRRHGLLILSSLLIALALLNPVLARNSALGYWSAPYILEFLIGVWLAVGARAVSWRAPSWVFWPAIAVLLCITIFYFKINPGESITLWSILLSSTFVFVGAFSTAAKDIGGIMSMIGNSSYSLYLTHMFVIRGGVIAFGLIGVVWPYWITWIILVAIACIVAWISFRVIEKPISELGKASRKRRKGALSDGV